MPSQSLQYLRSPVHDLQRPVNLTKVESVNRQSLLRRSTQGRQGCAHRLTLNEVCQMPPRIRGPELLLLAASIQQQPRKDRCGYNAGSTDNRTGFRVQG